MSSRAFSVVLTVVLLGTSAIQTAGVQAATEAEEAPSVCVDGWTSVPLPSHDQRWQAYEILTNGDEPTFLLGGADDGPLALSWLDGAWNRIDLGKDDTAALQAGAPRVDGSVWAVGSSRPARAAMAPIAGSLTPKRWRDRPVAKPPAERVAFAGVTGKGADRAWAVGTKLVNGHTRAYAARWAGSKWQQRSPSPGKGESGLTAVSSTDAGDVWAVGWEQARSGRLRPLIAKVRGSKWSTSRGAALPAGIGVMTDVVFRGRRDGWAVGYLVPEGESRHEVILEHWDGASWSLVELPWAPATSAIPRSIAVDDEERIWIAGTLLQEGSGARGFVAGFSDGAWQIHDQLLPLDSSSELFSVAVTADGAIAAGVAAADVIVLATCEPGTAAAVPATRDTADATEPSTTASVVAAPWTRLAGRLDLGRATKPDGFRIRDVAAQSGLAAVADTTNGLAEDLNADGWTDVLYWNHTDQPHFLLGGPDGFVDGSADAFGPLDRHWCSAADVDGNDVIDIFCSSGRSRGRAVGRHELSVGPGFEGSGPAADIGGAIDPFGRGRAATFIQLDDDGLPELFVATSADRGDGMPGMNRFYRNVGGQLHPAPDVGLDRSTGGWCAVAADIDADGDEDLLHCLDQSDDDRVEGLRIYRNENGKLRERSTKLGIVPAKDIGVVVADFTGDDRPDIVQLNRSKVRLSKGTAKGFKTIFEAAVPFALAVAAGDVNGDGALDLYVAAGSSNGNEPDFLLVNAGRGRSFQSVRIPQATDGSGSNVLALDYDHNGLTDFVVLNGNGRFEGTTQLLASFPADDDR